MVSSGVQFLRPVSVDDLNTAHFESFEKVEGIKQSGIVVLKVDSPPQPTPPQTMPSSPPKPNPNEQAIKALKAAEEAAEQLGVDYDRLWLIALLQSAQTTKGLFGSPPQATPPLTTPLEDLGNLAKERDIPIVAPGNFDESTYLESNLDVAAEVGEGGFGSGYEHYVLYGHLENRKRPLVPIAPGTAD